MSITAKLRAHFPFEPTADQAQLFQLLGEFLLDRPAQRPTFLLTGYAGTGKTTLVTSLVGTLPQLGFDCVLLAPTGRAAKVLATYTGQSAATIHKHIYRQTGHAFGEGGAAFQPLPNRAAHTVYVVDEASMIADDDGNFGQRGLLADLVSYVFMDGRRNNRLLLIGDPAQLPPVGQRLSPALDAGVLATRFGCQVTSCELRQVMRQAEESGILWNATALRQELARPPEQALAPKLATRDRRGIWAMSAEKLEDGLRYAYDKFGVEGTTVICRSNKQANQYNQLIRRVLFDAEDEIQGGDYLMIARNNYHWLPPGDAMGFLANGDFAEVRRVRRTEEIHGCRFVDARLRFVDYPQAPELDVKLLLDSLHADAPSLPAEVGQRLYQAVASEYDDLPTKAKRQEMLRKDPYLNALQVKFAYALTCHKAQGGQWGAVFLDHGFLKPDVPYDAEFTRWLYTAVTRAERELYLLNFKADLLAEPPLE